MKAPTLAHAYARLGAFDAIERLAPGMAPCMPCTEATYDCECIYLELTDGSRLIVKGPDIMVKP
jgi:hypothetical protein